MAALHRDSTLVFASVDSKLAQESSLTAVSEILNGCMYVFQASVVLAKDRAGVAYSLVRCKMLV